MDSLNIVIVGHVDHGKSTLIGRLMFDTESLPSDQLAELAREAGGQIDKVPFAHILDHLTEERERNITIDTAQTFFSTARRQYVIIDAPGHKQFVKNMVTGAGQADAALLVVAADEGVREQTRRHASLLALLGLRQVLIVVNKMDQVGWARETYDAVVGELRPMLADLGLPGLGYVPISAMQGEGMLRGSVHAPWYTDKPLLGQLDDLESPPRRHGTLAMPIQDVYPVDGESVAVGRVESGHVSVGEAVTLQPDGGQATIGAIKLFGDSPDRAGAGECIGVVLGGGVTPRRGQVIAAAGGAFPCVGRVRARAFWMAEQPLKIGAGLTLNCTTQSLPCRVEAIRNRIDSSSMQRLADEAGELAFTEVADLDIVLEGELVAETFDRLAPLGRFTLSVDDYPCGGGTILTTQ